MPVAVDITDTSTGVLLFVVVAELTPSWPLLLLPQHLIAPPVSRAHECERPRAMPVAVDIPDTATGVELLGVVEESTPSWP